MLIFIGAIGMVALLGIFLVGVGRAVRASDRPAALRRAIGALIGQTLLVVTLVLPAVEGLTHYAGVLASST
jgi:hypothetical protein